MEFFKHYKNFFEFLKVYKTWNVSKHTEKLNSKSKMNFVAIS